MHFPPTLRVPVWPANANEWHSLVHHLLQSLECLPNGGQMLLNNNKLYAPIQLIVSDTTADSPWQHWLFDPRLGANKTSLELLTMSIFPLGKCLETLSSDDESILGVILLVPMLLLSHFCFGCPLRWLPWLPLFLLLSLLPTFVYNGKFSLELPLVKGNATLDLGNGTSRADLLDVYGFSLLFIKPSFSHSAFLCISFAFLSVFYFIPIVSFIPASNPMDSPISQLFVAIFFFLCYRLLNRFNPKSNHSLRATRILDLLLLLPFLAVVLAMHVPTFVVNLSGFFILNIYPTISPYLLPLLSGPAAPIVPAGNSTASPAAPVVNPLMTTPWMMFVEQPESGHFISHFAFQGCAECVQPIVAVQG